MPSGEVEDDLQSRCCETTNGVEFLDVFRREPVRRLAGRDDAAEAETFVDVEESRLDAVVE
jgi:hypothetical protein